MPYIFLVILLAAIGVVGDFFIKLSGDGEKFIDVKWFVVGSLAYLSTIVGWFYVMKHIKLSSLGVIYALTTVILLVVVGVFYFHEKLNIYEIISVIAAIVSIILLGRFA
jgi:drug/metabolite transporter (DMT)-like permease